ncbi:MAG: alpha/beta hydrolase, partial [Butyrivibrio sp.]|nr:alpha/beta hydrolase [Butyrivibrio sp.]
MGKINRKLIALILALTCLLSMLLIIGVDTDWGKVETTHMVLTSADGDEISAMLYKPKNASPDHKVPLAMICHGGNDMLEQVGTYAVELSRRGIAVVSWDYTGCHNSDIATGPAEVTPDEISGLPTMGAETVWNTVKSYDFVDFDKIITMGHSMGGQYTIAFAIAHQDEVFLQLNLGMNVYGSADNHSHNFNFVNVLGDSDESCLARSGNNVMSLFQSEQMKQIFYGD